MQVLLCTQSEILLQKDFPIGCHIDRFAASFNSLFNVAKPADKYGTLFYLMTRHLFNDRPENLVLFRLFIVVCFGHVLPFGRSTR